MKVAVIGAGITGITTAYYAAKAGHEVTVFEEERYAAMKTSFANGGQISVSNSETWTTHSNVKRSIKWMFKKDAPLSFKPWRLDFAMWKWILKFLYHTYDGTFTNNTSLTVKMGLKSRKLYDEICTTEKIDFDRKNSGIIHFYKVESYWENAKNISDLYRLNGLDRDIIDHTTLDKIDPALKDIQGVIGATATHTDWTGDIHKFTYQLADILEKKYKVKFNYNTKIEELNSLYEFDKIIVANGVGSTKLAKSINETINVYPVKGYSITINNVDPKYLPKVSLLDDEAKIVTSTLGNKFRIAGTAELAGENYDIRRDRIEPLLKWVHDNFPNINTHDYTQWACLRPMTPNMMPILRQSKTNPKVYYNTGHGHLGWTLGPFTAQKICEIANLM